MKQKLPFSWEGLKKINKSHLLIAVLAGILLLVIAIPVEDKSAKEAEETPAQGQEAAGSDAVSDISTYKKNLEKQLKKILSAMDGVGEVEVMITLKDTGAAVVEKDITRTEESTREEDSQGTKRDNSVINSQQETIYIQEGTSTNTPFVTKEVNPQVEGVLIVAQGGSNATVVKNISDAVLALFSIEAHKIKVVKMN